MIARTTAAVLGIAAAVGFAAGWIVVELLEARGEVVLVSWPSAVLFVVLAAVMVSLGWPVRRWTRGDRDRPLEPLFAARVLAMALSASRAGALFCGWFVGHMVHLIPDIGIEARRDRLVMVVVVIVAAALFSGTGVLVEKWCQLPPEDDLDAVS